MQGMRTFSDHKFSPCIPCGHRIKRVVDIRCRRFFNPSDIDDERNFTLDAYNVNHKLSRKMSHFAKCLLGAGIQAVNDSGLSAETVASRKTGIVTGIGIGLSDGLDARS